MRFSLGNPRRRASLVAVLALVVFPASCQEQEPAKPTSSELQPSLRIGLIPERNIFSQKKRYKPIAEYLSTRIHARVELVALSRYGNIIENFVSNRLDGAFFGSFDIIGPEHRQENHIGPQRRVVISPQKSL